MPPPADSISSPLELDLLARDDLAEQEVGVIEGVRPIVLLDVSDGVFNDHRAVVPKACGGGRVEDADVRERPTDNEIRDLSCGQPAVELRLLERVVGVFLDHVIVLTDIKFVDDLGLPRSLEYVLAPAVELVVIVGVLELLGRVYVPRVDHLYARITGPIDERRYRIDRCLASGSVQAPVRMTEAVLHVDDDDRGAGWVDVHT